MIAIWYVLLVIPTKQKFSKIQNKLSDADTQITDFKKIMMIAPEFYKNHENIKRQKLQLSSQLYSKENLLSLFDEIENRASENNVMIVHSSNS